MSMLESCESKNGIFILRFSDSYTSKRQGLKTSIGCVVACVTVVNNGDTVFVVLSFLSLLFLLVGFRNQSIVISLFWAFSVVSK